MIKKDDLRKLLEMVANNNISTQDALKCYHSGKCPRETYDSSERQHDAGETGTYGQPDKIAVIGISGRFPGADDVNSFWNNIANGVNCVREICNERFDLSPYYDPNPNVADKTIGKWGAQLSNIDKFDPLFFNISSIQAEYMDPRQRLFLQEVWKSLEDACLSDRYLKNKKCSVYVGCEGSTDYFQNTNAELSAQYFLGYSNSILAARIAYFIDLKGASVTIDTGCSSSLVATHLACESLRRGESEIAIAGGVQLINRPKAYVLLSKIGMLSPTGQCSTFDDKADGMVPAEAVGVVVMKRLQDAIRDGNYIYGVIAGSGINQDGKTNGITSPSSASQIQLECDVYKKYGINPGQITYVEAHGTGTKLGDPIEVEALKNSFGAFTQKKGYCAIGSVKPNIGHAFAASGIVGMIKVLLCLKHKKIPPLLNFSKPNKQIDLENSPFYINTALDVWHIPFGSTRFAAVSSFGHSGTNAHVVVREHSLPDTGRSFERAINLYVFSAKTKDALKQKIYDFASWLKGEGATSCPEDIAFSLLLGRSLFQFRYAFVAESISELTCAVDRVIGNDFEGLTQTVSRKPDMHDMQRGKTLIEELVRAGFSSPDSKEKLIELARIFMMGCDISFDDLYSNSGYKYIPMPKYPFAKESYWIHEEEAGTYRREACRKKTALPPLIDENTSTLDEIRFSTVFSGNEEYLKYHRINGTPVLLGAAIVEMALEAVLAVDRSRRWNKVVSLHWMQPIKHTGLELKVNIGLRRTGEGHVFFEAYTEDNGVKNIGAVGELDSEHTAGYGPTVRSFDISEVISRCTLDFTGESCYMLLKQMGADLGKPLQGLKFVWIGRNEAVGKIELPGEASGFPEGCNFNPVLLDSAFQTVLGFLMASFGADSFQLYLPYSLERLEIYTPIPEKFYVLVSIKGELNIHDIRTQMLEFDLKVLSENGDILADIESYKVARYDMNSKSEGLQKPEYIKLLCPVWKESILEKSDAGLKEDKAGIIVFDTDEEVFRLLGSNKEAALQPAVLIKPGSGFRQAAPGVYELTPGNERDMEALVSELKLKNIPVRDILFLWPLRINAGMESNPPELLRLTYFTLLSLCRTLMKQQVQTLKLLYVFSSSLLKAFDSAAGAFARTLAQENPGYCIETVEMNWDSGEQAVDSREVLLYINELLHMKPGCEVKYSGRKRFEKILCNVKKVEPQYISANSIEVSFRKAGVYFITGGLGGIGFLVAGYLSENFNARLVLTGRSELSYEMKSRLKELEAKGAKAVYIKADCSSQQEVEMALKAARERFGCIHGIIHCAGVLHDSYILNKTQQEAWNVFKPKIMGTLNLDLASRLEKLDFFILFSSLSAVFGNIGQSDYAYANSFMDAFAVYREELREKGERNGKSTSINWPYWKDGRMPVNEMVLTWMEEKLGVVPLERNLGLDAMKKAITQKQCNIVVLPTSKKLDSIFPIHSEAQAVKDADKDGQGKYSHEALVEYTEKFLKGVISSQTKIPLERLDAEEPFENYGIDSNIITRLNFELEKSIPGLSKTLFFEYKNIKGLVKYFLSKHEKEIFELSRNANEEARGQSIGTQKAEKTSSLQITPTGYSYPVDMYLPSASLPESEKAHLNIWGDEIAIVGVSGKYPMADNLEEFWDNLTAGRDCISEIPKERWDYSCWFDPDREKRGGIYAKWGGFINGVDEFDPAFFKISPREAEMIDPQERIFLQCVYHTLEDAGYTAASLNTKRVGVFVGVMYGHYQLYSMEAQQKNITALSSSYASIANRVSYFYDFYGPSIALDTMCSSSLTAIHLACSSIRNGECDMALAGGVNVTIHPVKYALLCTQKFASSDGRCRSFGEGGDGYVPGEGVGAVLIKPLSKAIKDNDNIYAVIKGSAVNHCGRTNGYTVPDPNQQGALITEALQKATMRPESIGYIEAHGTGTSLGDPIEISGLTKAFDYFAPSMEKTCPIGSVKSNIGHLESAAGIAGITKVLLMMKNRKLVPSIHSKNINPNINFKDSYFSIQHKLEDWDKRLAYNDNTVKLCPRSACISAFGAGGANAHIILEEYEALRDEDAYRDMGTYIIVLSAMSEEQLKEKAANLSDYLTRKLFEPFVTLRNVAFTLQVGREQMGYRLAVVVSSLKDLIGALRSYLSDGSGTGAFHIYTSENRIEANSGGFAGKNGAGEPDTLAAQGKLDELASIWASGVDVDWKKLFSGYGYRRITLPNYPFKKKRYWFDSFEQAAENKKTDTGKGSEISTFSCIDWDALAEGYQGNEVVWNIIDGTIALIRIQDKKNKNMFTREVVTGLISAFKGINADENIKVVVVTGYDNVFCMGGTKEALTAISENRAEFTDMPFLYKGFLENDLPIITGIQGHAFGGGLLFGLYGDITVMAEEGLYCANFMNFGFTPGMGATIILKEKLGGIATEMMFTGKTYRGEEIKKRGGASVIFSPMSNVLYEALNVARSLSKKPKDSLRVLKRELAGRLLPKLDEALEKERLMHKLTFSNDEVQQKISRYFERNR